MLHRTAARVGGSAGICEAKVVAVLVWCLEVGKWVVLKGQTQNRGERVEIGVFRRTEQGRGVVTKALIPN